MSACDLAALILAGGQSSRLGTDKALLDWQGQPLLQRVATTAAAIAPTVSVLTPWPDRYWLLLGDTVTWLPETQPGAGPLVALSDGLQQLAAQRSPAWIWALACDLPRLDAAVVQGWRDRLAALPADCWALVPRVGDRWEPLCGFYRPAVLSHLQAFQQQGGRSFQRWLPTLPATPIQLAPADATLLWNCNTPADFTAD